jgi:hypothetical protein
MPLQANFNDGRLRKTRKLCTPTTLSRAGSAWSADFPNKPHLVQSFYALLRDAGFPLALSLSIHPYSELKAVLNMTVRNAAMSFTFYVSF